MVLIRLNGWHAYHMLMILHDTSEIGWLMRAINKKEHRKSIYVSTGSSSEIPLMPQVDHDSCKESTRTSRMSLCAYSNRKWQRDVIDGSEISLMSQVCHDIMQAVNKNIGNRYTFLYEMTSRYHWYTIHHDGHPMGLFTDMAEGSRCSTASISSNASPNVEEY